MDSIARARARAILSENLLSKVTLADRGRDNANLYGSLILLAAFQRKYMCTRPEKTPCQKIQQVFLSASESEASGAENHISPDYLIKRKIYIEALSFIDGLSPFTFYRYVFLYEPQRRGSVSTLHSAMYAAV